MKRNWIYKHIKTLLSSIIVFSISYSVFAQTDSINTYQDKPLKYSLETGTSFSSFKGTGNASLFYIAPGFSYSSNPKWSLNVKTFIVKNNFSSYNYLPFESTSNYNPANAYVSLYADGEYSFNEKIHVKGAVYKNLNSIQNNFSSTLTMNSGLNEFYSLGLFYNITKNIQIGAEFRYVDYRSNFYNPFYYNRFNSGF